MTRTYTEIMAAADERDEREARELLGPGNWTRVNRVWGACDYRHYYRDERTGACGTVIFARAGLPVLKTDHALRTQTVILRHRRRQRSRYLCTTSADPTVASQQARALMLRATGQSWAGWREYGQSRTLIWPQEYRAVYD